MENNKLASSRNVGMRDINALLQSAPISRITTLRDDEGRRGFTLLRHPEFILGSSRIPNKGFTLLEVLVVVLIIGILTAVAVPLYERAMDKAALTEVFQVFHIFQQQAELALLEHSGLQGVVITGQDGPRELFNVNPFVGMDCRGSSECISEDFVYEAGVGNVDKNADQAFVTVYSRKTGNYVGTLILASDGNGKYQWVFDRGYEPVLTAELAKHYIK